MPDYPGSSGNPAAVNYMESLGAVMAFGGEALADSFKCWAFDGSSWTSLPDSIQYHCMYNSPNVISAQGWWLAGWLQTEDGFCSESEWTSEIYTGEEWVDGPQQPIGFSAGACLVNINSTHTLLTGGQHNVSSTWLYDWTAGVWTSSGELNQGRQRHGCAVVEGQGVLVAGGYDEHYLALHSVELYDPETGIWTPQPSIPEDINPGKPSLLAWHSSTVLALFVWDDNIYQRSASGTWTALEGVFLPETFIGSAALVPDDFIFGCMQNKICKKKNVIG